MRHGWTKRSVAVVVLISLLAGYVSSYIVLSRRGTAWCEAHNVDGLYFFPPEDTGQWRRWNYGCVAFFYPLIVLDNWIGTGKDFGREPTWRLSR
jgi:hypothetical protein